MLDIGDETLCLSKENAYCFANLGNRSGPTIINATMQTTVTSVNPKSNIQS